MTDKTLWNKGQSMAINSRAKNILVSASAGTGKTTVMVERILRRLLDKNDPLTMDRFIMVTFTEASASEMKLRLAKAISEEIAKDPHNRYLRKLKLQIGQAKISTLHSFALDLIREYYYLIDFDPTSKILDETSSIIILNDVLDQILDNMYDNPSDDFIACMNTFSGDKNDESIRSLIRDTIFRYANATPDPVKWLNWAKEQFQNSSAPVLNEFLTIICGRLKSMSNDLDKCIENIKDFDYLEKQMDNYASSRLIISDLSKCTDWDNFIDSIENVNPFSRMPSVPKENKKGIDPELFEKITVAREKSENLRAKVKKEYEDLTKSLLGETIAVSDDEKASMSPVVLKLIDLSTQLFLGYQKAKREANLIDFSDFEHFAIKLLYDEKNEFTDIAKSIQNHYLEILVDEYQDTNKVQEAILNAISNTSRFMVGDIKQSIYGFRHASPKLFQEKFDTYSLTDEKNNHLIILDENYRSLPNILSSVNDLFSDLMTKETSSINYSENGRFMVPGAPERTEKWDIEDGFDLVTLSDEDILDEEDEISRQLHEGIYIASKIKELHGKTIYDSKAKKVRPLEYKDFVILVKSRTSTMEPYTKALTSYNIPVYADVPTGYFDSQEIMVCINFLTIVDNPDQDIPLVATLLSPAFGFTEDEMAKVRINSRGSSVLKALKSCKNKDLKKKISNFFNELEEYRRIAKSSSVSDLLNNFLNKTNYVEFVAAMPNSKQRLANLEALKLRAKEYETGSKKGLYHFIKFITTLKESGQDLGPAAVCGENDDVVRIMTIHHSKGLEFPIVFLSNLSNGLDYQDLKKNLVVLDDFGIGIKFFDTKKHVKYTGAYFLALKEISRKELKAESLRLLYVALTRAKNHVYLTAMPGKICKESYLTWVEPVVDSCIQKGFRYWKKEILPSGDYKPGVLNDENKRIWSTIITTTPKEEDKYKINKESLEWLYTNGFSTTVPTKYSVTESYNILFPKEEEPLKEAPWVQSKNNSFKTPDFISKKANTSLLRGNSCHKVLSKIDYLDKNIQKNDYFKDLSKKLYEQLFLSQEEYEALDFVLINNYKKSTLFKRILKAAKKGFVKTEADFTMNLPISNFYPETLIFTDDTTLIQGSIDLFFEEEDGLVVVDFKTDKVSENEEDILINRYKGQLYLYEMALNKLYKEKRVKEKIIFSLTLGKAITIN